MTINGSKDLRDQTALKAANVHRSAKQLYPQSMKKSLACIVEKAHPLKMKRHYQILKHEGLDFFNKSFLEKRVQNRRSELFVEIS